MTVDLKKRKDEADTKISVRRTVDTPAPQLDKANPEHLHESFKQLNQRFNE